MHRDAGLAPVSFMLVPLVRVELRAESARHMWTLPISLSFYFRRFGDSSPSFLFVEKVRGVDKFVVYLRSCLPTRTCD